jgi:hypothetical protein
MGAESTFDQLASQLSPEERNDLISKINASVTCDQEPVADLSAQHEELDLEKIFRSLGFFKRLFILIKAFFSSKEWNEIFEDELLQQISRRVERVAPGIINYATGDFEKRLTDKLLILMSAVQVFTLPLKKALGTERNDFIAFIGGMELPLIERKLVVETNPYNAASQLTNPTNHEVKQRIEDHLDDIFENIPNSDRQRMYMDIQSLQLLFRLSSFPLNHVLKLFVSSEGSGTVRCSFPDLRPYLVELTNILFSMTVPPGPIALQAIFMFTDVDEQEREDSSEEYLKKMIRKSNNALSQMRNFVSLVPLIDLMKLISRNLSYVPKKIGGGEDWFVVFRTFWHNRSLKLYDQYILEKKRKLLEEEMKGFVRAESVKSLQYYQSGIGGKEIQVQYPLTLGFIQTFQNSMYEREILPTLKIILINGEFYKKQNREDFTRAVETIEKDSEQIGLMEEQLAVNGEIGKEIEKIKKEMAPLRIRLQEIKEQLKKADIIAEEVVRVTQKNFQLLIDLLKGILYGEVGGRYDTLRNLAYISQKEGESLRQALPKVLANLEVALKLIQQSFDLETRLIPSGGKSDYEDETET